MLGDWVSLSEDADKFEHTDHRYTMSLTCFSLRDGDSISDSHTCLVDMKTIEEEEEDEEEEDYETEKINIEQIEKSLRRRRQIKLVCISIGFILSVALVTYSVLVDINNQKSKF